MSQKKKDKKKTDEEVILRRRYRSLGQGGAFAGAEGFLRALGKKKKHAKDQIRQILQAEPAYTLHRPVRRKFLRRKTIVSGPFDQFQCDLVDVSAYKKDNDGTRFLLCVIDVFSRYAWVRALKTKTGKEVAKAFKEILEEADRIPLHVQTDKGKEFRTSAFEGLCKRQAIEVFSTENDDIKASLVERFQRTLQTIMHRHFTSTRSRAFLDVLPKMVQTYNNTFHRAIGMTPAQVGPSNYEAIWHRLYGGGRARKSSKLRVGDNVRISKTRRTFKKGYLPHWTLEIFRIRQVLATSPTTYRLEDFAGEALQGSFYEQELQVVKPPAYYDVERILGTRTRRGRKEYLVKWHGYPHSFNSWESDIIRTT